MTRDKRGHLAWKIAINCAPLLLYFALTRIVHAAEHQADMYVDTFYIHESNHDLGTPDSSSDEAGIDVRPRLYSELSENWHSLISLQLFYANEPVELRSDQFDEVVESDGFVSLRQLWLEWGGLTPYPGEALRFGRERLRLNDGLVLDSDILTARWAWDTSLLKGGVGVAEELSTFRSDEFELPEAEKNLRRIYGMLRWQYSYNSFLSGHVINTDGSDNTVTAPQLTWSGASIDNGYFDYRIRLPWQYYLTAYGVSGHETLNGVEVDVSGWAMDGGMRWRSDGAAGLSAGVQLTTTDDKPNGYRQTGLQSNRAYYTGARGNMHRFGEALRPDFRNMAIATLYLGLLPEDAPWEVGVAGHTLQLRDEAGPFSARGFSMPTDGVDTDLGRAVDLIMSWYWSKHDNNPMFEDIDMDSYLRILLSGFYPGEAFDAGGDARRVNRGIIDWVVKF
jgi:alginate production protein